MRDKCLLMKHLLKKISAVSTAFPKEIIQAACKRAYKGMSRTATYKVKRLLVGQRHRQWIRRPLQKPVKRIQRPRETGLTFSGYEADCTEFIVIAAFIALLPEQTATNAMA